VVPGDVSTWGGRIAVAKLGEPGRILDQAGGVKATVGVTRRDQRQRRWVAPTADSVRGEYGNLVGTLKRARSYADGWKKYRAAHTGWTKVIAATQKKIVAAKAKNEKAPDLPKEPPRPGYDPELEALIPVIEKKMPLRIEVHGVASIRGALAAARAADVRLVLDAASGIGAIADEIPQTVSVVVAMRGWGGPREAAADAADAGALSRAGVPVAVASFGPTATRAASLLDLAAVAVREGMPAERALRALTMDAAAAIGMERRLGRIARGCDADVVALDGDPFDPKTKVVWVMIDGKIVYRSES
jgi:imidazolonepropionase-like amidohydrolase